MKKEIGLWIDHRKAVIVIIKDGEEEIKKIKSNMEKDVRFSSGDGSEDGSSEDVRDRQFENHLKGYYDQVIACIRDADSILILGPGEAKGELGKRIEREGLKAHIHPIETEHKMTDRQILAKVRERFSVQNMP
jgi:stalled ribosome rescue protein Dom34